MSPPADPSTLLEHMRHAWQIFGRGVALIQFGCKDAAPTFNTLTSHPASLLFMIHDTTYGVFCVWCAITNPPTCRKQDGWVMLEIKGPIPRCRHKLM